MREVKTKKTHAGNRLTAREREVLELLCQGQDMPDKQIADRLKISISGVRRHFEKMAAKLDMHSRLSLALWWLQTRRRGAQGGVVDSPSILRGRGVGS
jgi:DNA-binding CsgD family transcriptional regulator